MALTLSRERVATLLPRGDTLPADAWARRHRLLLAVLWVHVPMLVAFGLLVRGATIRQVAFDLTPVVLFGLAGRLPRLTRRARAGTVAVGLLCTSAALVHLADGATEAHFHFFVVVALLALYDEWVPYVLALTFAVLHHAAEEILVAGPAEHHGGHPGLSALVHGVFVAAVAVVNLVTWRLDEDLRAIAARAHARTLRSETQFRGAFDGAPVGMALATLDGCLTRVNRALCAMTGRTEEDLLGRPLADVVVDDDRRADTEGDDATAERQIRRADGALGWSIVSRHLIPDEHGRPSHYVIMAVDVSARRAAEASLAYDATHDALTGLPNRAAFDARLRDALGGTAAGRPSAVLFIDLDDFKSVNDALGHQAGDELLTIVAERLRGAVRPEDLVARVGGDEFLVLLDGVGEADAVQIAAGLRADLHEPCDIFGQRRVVTASVGIATTERSLPDADALVRDGDAAMYRAKGGAKGGCVVFDEDLREQAVEQLVLEYGLREALGAGQLELHYQPEIDIATGRTVAVEALLRWRDEDRGLIPPALFIPIAEASGLIVPIGAWVIGEACRQAAAWRAAGVADGLLTMAVNLSPRQFAEPDLTDTVREALRAAGLPAERLCLEITETAVMADPDRAAVTLRELKTLGVRLAVDDFGTGWSSLGHLRFLLPVDVLKIDRSFVRGLTTDPADLAIVTAIVDLARRLGLATVAEGVEEAGQLEVLRSLGCTLAQGFAFSPAEPAAVLEARFDLRRAA